MEDNNLIGEAAQILSWDKDGNPVYTDNPLIATKPDVIEGVFVKRLSTKARPITQHEKDDTFIAEFPSQGAAAEFLKGTPEGICQAIKQREAGKNRHYKGFIWKYKI